MSRPRLPVACRNVGFCGWGMTLKWWAYIHTNGSIQLKRYFGPLDLSEARESPFVRDIIQPFDAADREAAFAYVNRLVNSPGVL